MNRSEMNRRRGRIELGRRGYCGPCAKSEKEWRIAVVPRASERGNPYMECNFIILIRVLSGEPTLVSIAYGQLSFKY